MGSGFLRFGVSWFGVLGQGFLFRYGFSGLRVSWFRVFGSGFQVSRWRFRVSHLGFSVFRVSRLRVGGVGFCIRGAGIGVRGFEVPG